MVLGAGMAGLLAARVLSEFYETVTIVERDQLPRDAPAAQGDSTRAPRSRIHCTGSQVLGRLFPGLLDELRDAGANVWDDATCPECASASATCVQELGQIRGPVGVCHVSGKPPFSETHVRRRVRVIDNVVILDGHDAVAPVADTPDRVTGVRVVNRETGEPTVLNAQLVVDAMGRGASTPAFLDSLGYGRPAEQRSTTRVVYASQLMHIPPGIVTEKMTLVVPGWWPADRRRDPGLRKRHYDRHRERCRRAPTTRLT